MTIEKHVNNIFAYVELSEKEIDLLGSTSAILKENTVLKARVQSLELQREELLHQCTYMNGVFLDQKERTREVTKYYERQNALREKYFNLYKRWRSIALMMTCLSVLNLIAVWVMGFIK